VAAAYDERKCTDYQRVKRVNEIEPSWSNTQIPEEQSSLDASAQKCSDFRNKPMPEDDEIVDSLDEATEVIPFTYSITSYGADYPVDSLVKRVTSDYIIVPTFEHYEQLSNDLDAFQREYVWTRAKADKFIESLLLGLPVPGIFLVKEPSGRFLVLDGHQRLFTLRAFCDGIIQGKEYRLQGVQKRFEGKTYRELDVEDRRRIDDSIIHATVVRQDHPSEDWSSIYVIFERLNTGGISLQPQEIRMALYHGEFASTSAAFVPRVGLNAWGPIACFGGTGVRTHSASRVQIQ
jgi:hypothetical protein